MAKKRRTAKKNRAHRAPPEAAPAAERSDDSAERKRTRERTPLPAEAPHRLAVNLFIGAFLAYQVAMPVRYYLEGGGYDERFSWRMFSSVRMQRCRVSVDDLLSAPGAGQAAPTRDVDLPHVLHIAWIRILERGRPAVVEKFLQRRCEEPDVAGARYVLRCIDPDGTRVPDQTVELDCRSGQLLRSGGSS